MTARHMDVSDQRREDCTRVLRRVLTLDAVVSGLAGVLLVTIGAAALADLFGLPAAFLVPIGGGRRAGAADSGDQE